MASRKLQAGALLFACNVNDKSYNSAKIPHNRKVPIPFSISLLYAKNIRFYFLGNKNAPRGSHCSGMEECRLRDPPQAENPASQDS
ncbi:MAG: hypothetical protein EGP68_13475, partial [Lachnospiraceae bacterium]|nr:hypothetical protein [Lachnospiraceae bacterium]